MQLLLRKSGYNFHTTAEKEVVRIIKEKTCYIALNPAKEEKETSGKVDDFMLPDGNIIKVRLLIIILIPMLIVLLNISLALKDFVHLKSCFILSLLEKNTLVFTKSLWIVLVVQILIYENRFILMLFYLEVLHCAKALVNVFCPRLKNLH